MVVANLRRYSTREVNQMDKVEQLMQRMGHMTSKATVCLIVLCIKKCPVSASCVYNNDAAKGVSVADLLGKTTKFSPYPLDTCWLPVSNKCSKV
jgi:hypothetical protein